MQLKDYYQTLGVGPAASADDIKSAYRALALKYHPDRAADNPFAAAHFRELAEAYAVLSHPARRRAYDEERWLRGATTRSRNAQRISPEWILSEVHRLEQHMATIDTYRMSHAALRDYILLLLSDEHLSIWRSEATPEQQEELLTGVLNATKGQKLVWFGPVAARLLETGNPDGKAAERITTTIKARKRSEALDKWMPLIVLIIAIGICAAIFWGLHT